tara:strand:+ start:32 stop:664 length:633 start_codon:yes stop_codon:yes gene_type:complete
MIFKPHNVKNLGYLVVENLYSSFELNLIWNEIGHIDYVLNHVFDEKAKSEHRKSHNGTDENLNPLMSGFGISLDAFYMQRKFSAILKFNRKVMGKEIGEHFKNINSENSGYELVNTDFTLLNKYRKGEQYKKHRDSSSFSAVTFLSKTDLNGGGLEFCDYDVRVPFKNNSCVIFPSRAYHQTEEIKSNIERYSISQFMTIRYYTDRYATS